MPDPQLDRFWGVPTQALVSHLGTTQEGLTQSEAQRRLSQVGPNTLTRHSGPSVWGLLLSQFQSPLVLILVGACVMSLVASEWVDAAVVLAIVLISTLMGFAQETMAHAAMVVCVALILPYSPVAGLFDFVPLPPHLLLALVGVSLAYAATVEWGKQVFYRRR
jgi:Mg2+-importing ATPase